jgi:cell division septum initiation protein DivIVA
LPSITDDINAISDKVLALEQENARLKNDLETEKKTNASIQIAQQWELEEDHAREQKPDLRDKLIKLMAPDIENQEKLKGTSPRIQEIVAVYREIYPGGTVC